MQTMLRKNDAKTKIHEIYLSWRVDAPTPPRDWPDSRASDFFRFLREHHAHLLEFRNAGVDRWQTVKGWVLNWDNP